MASCTGGDSTAKRHEGTCRERERRRNMGDARPTAATAGIWGERERRGSAASREETATRRRGDGEGTRVRESSGWDGAASAVVATRHGDGTGMTRGGVDATGDGTARNRSAVGLGTTRLWRGAGVGLVRGRCGADVGTTRSARESGSVQCGSVTMEKQCSDSVRHFVEHLACVSWLA
uniref:Uncharacterized protein n=1 Tax=Oryza sativa subsp. japonica TaxID=39947 RepID=Q8LIC0_ORYSJ|nr:hypothetical protein [Oryza sativa Japonica Group]